MKILLPIDDSDCAVRTVQWAAETFNKETSRYHLLHVLPYILPVAGQEGSVLNEEIWKAKKLLYKTRAFLREQQCKIVKSELLQGDPVFQICHYAKTAHVDQVVIGSHGRTGFKKLLLGSVSIAVLEHCERPVLVCRNFEPKTLEQNPRESHSVFKLG
jgi:nucleotide-binding universal stress UspA family protein